VTVQSGLSAAVRLPSQIAYLTRVSKTPTIGAFWESLGGQAELKKIRRYKLIIIDEVGYIPFDQDAANLFFQLIASRYEQGSVMVTSNLPFGRWGETFSDDVVAAAM
jgi:DNA replication protein DnaC